MTRGVEELKGGLFFNGTGVLKLRPNSRGGYQNWDPNPADDLGGGGTKIWLTF